ncbi:metal-dependent hydrolase [Gorillibacterium sp. sgz5001074]|uniref:metal-dependent hydrolase n=1 Tax=Gorillibacterium sp. sgz5001074 TaxID=3446695 RepID=UPI003F671007
MDTGSHLLFGATLAGLAFMDPAVAGSPELAHAILAGTLIGSHAPDFDAVTRLWSYDHYIRHHRGITHSLPALLVWPAFISLPLAGLYDVWGQIGHLYFWVMLAVGFHVFLDLFNAYGVQCFRPFSRRWFHLDILALYEPFLFLLHTAGLIVWLSGQAEPGGLFLGIYAGTFVYIFVRGVHHAAVVRRVRQHFAEERGICHVVPGLHWFRWSFVVETDRCFYTGHVRSGKVTLHDTYPKDGGHPAAQATLGTRGVRAFLHFAQRVHVRILESRDGYRVEWRDMRFWHDHKLPFGVDVLLDRNMNVEKEHLGWSKKAWDPPYV